VGSVSGSSPQLRSALRDRRFLRLTIVQTLNMLGDGLLAVGVPILLAGRGAGAAHLGAYTAAFGVAAVASLLFASGFIDTLTRRTVLLGADALRLLSVAVLGLYVAGTASTMLLIASGAAAGIGISVFRPAYSAYIGEIVDCELRRSANALRSFSSKVSSVIAPGAVGLIALVGSTAYVLPAAAVFTVASVLVLLGLPTGGGGVSREEFRPLDGAREVLARPWVLGVVAQGALQIGLVVTPLTVLVPVWLADRAVVDQYGFMMAIDAAGALLGAVAAMRIRSRLIGLVAMAALTLQAPLLAAIALDAPIWAWYVGYFLSGVSMAVFGVLWVGALQQHVPEAALGRVFSIDALANASLAPVGALIAVAVAAHVSMDVAAAAGLVVLLASIAMVLPVRGIATFGNLEPPESSTTKVDAPSASTIVTK
jgi:MFS family permease